MSLEPRKNPNLAKSGKGGTLGFLGSISWLLLECPRVEEEPEEIPRNLLGR